MESSSQYHARLIKFEDSLPKVRAMRYSVEEIVTIASYLSHHERQQLIQALVGKSSSMSLVGDKEQLSLLERDTLSDVIDSVVERIRQQP